MSKSKKAQKQAATVAVAQAEVVVTAEKKQKKVVELTTVAPQKTADMSLLKATCEAIIAKDAASLSESEMLVASAAMNVDRWSDLRDKKAMMQDVNERCSFGAYYYRDAAEERQGKLNLYRATHRDISAHYGCKLGRATNLLTGTVKQTAFNSHNNKVAHQSQSLRISDEAVAVLKQYATAIAAKCGK